MCPGVGRILLDGPWLNGSAEELRAWIAKLDEMAVHYAGDERIQEDLRAERQWYVSLLETVQRAEADGV